MDQLTKITANVEPVGENWIKQAIERQNSLTKPPGSLGTLEDIACRVAAIQKSLSPAINRKRIVVFAADHGVVEEGVSPYPQQVTAQMVANFLRGGAAINAIAQAVDAEVIVVNIGVKHPIPVIAECHPSVHFIDRPIRRGTRNFVREPALTEEEVLSAIEVGIDIANESKAAGVDLIGLGEMGIGNTTTSAAITAALTGLCSTSVTGRGTGADDHILGKKRSVVEKGLQLHVQGLLPPLSILCAFGGLEVAGLMGVCLGAAANRTAIVLDGFIATAGAALAARQHPPCAHYYMAGHLSAEPGHAILLQMLKLEPILNLRMRLGEGTGAALGMKIVEAAVRAFNDMATFDSAGVSAKQAAGEKAVH